MTCPFSLRPGPLVHMRQQPQLLGSVPREPTALLEQLDPLIALSSAREGAISD